MQKEFFAVALEKKKVALELQKLLMEKEKFSIERENVALEREMMLLNKDRLDICIAISGWWIPCISPYCCDIIVAN